MVSKLEWMRQQLYQVAEPCPEWWQFIKQNKIDLSAVEPFCGVVGVALCNSHEIVDGNRLFEFSENGITCVLIEAICFRREEGNTNPYPSDLVAWPLNQPDQFATALGAGEGCELLGAWSACRDDRSPLTVHQTPLAWLRAGCEGCVMLKPGAEYWLNKAGGPFVCQDGDQALELKHMLGTDSRQHKILIPNPERIAA